MKRTGMRKMLSIFLSLVMILGLSFVSEPNEVKAAAPGGKIAITANKENVQPGGTYKVTVALNDNTKATALELTYSFDKDKVEMVDKPEKGEAYGSAIVDINASAEKGFIKVVAVGQEHIINGSLFTVEFKVKNNAEGIIKSSIKGNMLDADVNDVTYEVDNQASDISVVIPVTAISLNKKELVLGREETGQLFVTKTPTNTTDIVSWESNDTGVAEVDENGIVTAKKIGTATITVKAGNYTDTCEVKVNAPLKSIVPEENSLELVKKQTAEIKYTLNPEDTTDKKDVTFKSDNPEVAEVSVDGKVTAKKAGTAVITLTGANNVTATVAVTVTEIPINQVVLDKQNATVEKGATVELTATVKPDDTTDDNTDITWTSSDESIATVSKTETKNKESVTITATDKGGKVTITATAANGTKAECEITVPIHIESVTIPEKVTIHRGNTETLEAVITPENTTDDKTITWVSDKASVATVDSTGKVTAVGIGTATITASVGGKTDTCTVTVDAPLVGITPEKAPLELVKKQTAEIKYTLNPTDTTDDTGVTFTSDKPEVAEVSATGVVTAKKAGTAVITLTGANNVTATVAVTVTEIPINQVVLDKQNATVEKGATVELTATVKPDDTTDDNTDITWTSSDESIATVSKTETKNKESVTVTATDKGGKVTITATAANGTKAECEIIVPIHIESVTIPETVTINRGSSETLKAVIEPENTTDDKVLTWKSSNESVVKVDITGEITAVKAGTADITVTTVNGKTDVTEVTVKEYHLDADLGDKLELEEPKDPVLQGQKMDLNTLLNLDEIVADNQITDDITIEWLSEDEDILTVDSDGVAKGLKAGKAKVKAIVKAVDGSGNEVGVYEVSAEIEVKEIPLESIAFNKVITEMTVGQTEQLLVIFNPQDTTADKSVVWSSSDSSVISVENGKITALKAGTADITAKVGDKIATCTIIVKDKVTAGNNGTTGGQGTVVKTGDTNSIGLYVMLLLLSLGIVLVLSKRKLYNNIRR